jgi:plastocyanin
MNATRRIRRILSIGAAALVTLATLCAVAQVSVPSGPNRIAFPAGYAKDVLYATVDRHDTKQHREFYTSAGALKSVREGKGIPYGTVITLVAYKAEVDAAGVPLRDANGRFVKGEVAAITVMQKERGFGASIPETIRNGEWEYQAFNADGSVNAKANLAACYECHKPFAAMDYVTNLAKLEGTFPSGATVERRAGPADVTIAGFAFGPGKVTVQAGQSVTWTNADDSPHQVSLAGKAQRSGLMLKGQRQSLKFDEAGMFDYMCGLHPGMKGSVEVVKP